MVDDLQRLKAALARSGGASSDFDLNPGVPPPQGSLRPAAVLVPVLATGDAAAQVILTKRASHLKHHPGQVAFPGGKMDKTDHSLSACALREAWEEIGLPPESVTILGELPVHVTVTGFAVTPILGHVRAAFTPKPQVEEVEEVFSVPLSHLLDESRYTIQSRIWRGQMRRFYTVPWGPYYIWGATARMLRGLADRVATCG